MSVVKEYKLETKYDSRKSFGGKARVVEHERYIQLYSYNSHICTIVKNFYGRYEDRVSIIEYQNYDGESLTFSSTSLRHLKEFLKQNGLKAESKEQIIRDYEIIEGGQINVDKGRR